MRHKRLALCFTLIFSCLTLSDGRAAAGLVGGRSVSEITDDVEPALGQKGARQTGDAKERKTKPPTPGFSKDIDSLRAQFNGDKGRVRLLMLLSPT